MKILLHFLKAHFFLPSKINQKEAWMTGCDPNTGFWHALIPSFFRILEREAFSQVSDTATCFCFPVSASNQCVAGPAYLTLAKPQAEYRTACQQKAPVLLCTVSVSIRALEQSLPTAVWHAHAHTHTHAPGVDRLQWSSLLQAPNQWVDTYRAREKAGRWV